MNFKNIIFVGPQKTGTSLIYEYLKNIPVSRTFPKETFYFQLNNKVKMEQYLLKFKSLSTYLVEISLDWPFRPSLAQTLPGPCVVEVLWGL